MKRILLFTMMCLFGLFSLNAQETSFSYDFEDGSLTGWRVYQGSYATGDNWQVADAKGKDGSKGIYSASVVPGGWGGIEYTPNNYVVTTNAYQITATSSLSWYMVYEDLYLNPSDDTYQVVASEDGSNFNTVIWTGNGSNSGENTVSLSEYAGKTLYLGFYHYIPNSYGNGGITLDNIALTVGEGGGETPGEGGDDEGDDETNNVVVIGDGAGTSNQNRVPVNTSQAKCVSQQIYTASEINHAAGEISNLGFNVVMGNTTRQWAVYMANTEKEAFSSTSDWVYGAEKVFDGEVAIPVSGWMDIEFDNNFNYEGKNIVLMVYDYTSGTISGPKFTNDNNANYVALTTFNVTDVNSLSPGTLRTCKNQIQLTFAVAGEDGETPDPTPDPDEPTLDLTKQYRVKAASLDKYFYVLDNDAHASGTNGGVIVYNKVEGDNNQLFTLEDAGNGAYYFKSASGYYLYCQEWNVDAYSTTAKTALKMVDQGDGTFYLQNTNNNRYFKVEQVGMYYYPFCDCDGSNCTIEKWTLEAVDNGTTPEPTAPEAPVVTAEAAGQNSLVLTWEAVANATSYKVYSAGYEIAEVTETTYTVNYLQAGTEYCFSVTAVNEVGESEATEACATTETEQGGDEPGDVCVVEFILGDSYGDGWSNNILRVSYGNVSEDLSFIVASYNVKEFTKEYTLEIPKGSHVTVTYIPGASYPYPEENSFIVRYQDGKEIHSVAVGSLTTDGYAYEFDVDCTPEAPETPTVTAETIGDTEILLTMSAAAAKTFTIYQGAEVLVENYAEVTYVVSGLTPETEYCFSVKAFNEVGESELSEEVCATTYKEGTVVVEIGEGDEHTTYQSPVADFYLYSVSQTIYTEEEIGVEAGKIVSVAYNKASGAHNTRNISVYMKHTDKATISAWETLTSEDLCVYSGAYTFGSTGWNTIDLQEAFSYTGGNLLVCVVDNTATSASIYDNFYTYKPGVQRAIYGQSSYTAIDPYNITINTLPIYDNSYAVRSPQTKFVIEAKSQGGNDNDEPAEITHRLVSMIGAQEWNNVTYNYESETSNVVNSVDKGSYRTLIEYNEDGTIAKTTYVFMWNGAPDYDSDHTITTYSYTDGVLTSYKETPVSKWTNPSETEYALTYQDGLIVEKSWPNTKETYEYENGRLVKLTKSYYDQWASTPGYTTEYFNEYEYDANGNCIKETKYTTYGDEPTAQNGVDYYYDMTIAAENVATFAYPYEVLPAHANLVTKTLSYYYREDWQTGEVSKEDYSVTVYNYNPEVVAAPFAPMDLKANVLSDTQISLTWTSIETAESFNVYCNGELAGNATETYYTVEGLKAATEYTFTVKGVNGNVESEASNEAVATTMQLVNIVPNAIAFGDVKMGEYWAENPTGVEVKINPLGKTITSIATDNDFFRVPATINLTENPVTFKVDYKKSAEAGEYTGNLVVTLSTDETVTIPLSATAYAPVSPDVFELAQEIEFVDGAYADAPDFTTLHDDYNLPNEAEGNNPDAVYAFTLTEDNAIVVEVEGENAVYAIYKAFGEDEGPTATNAIYGDETILSTAFSYDFESADLSDFTIIDNDEFKDFTWTVEEGSLVSYSFVPTPDHSEPYYIANDADERIITNKAYAITANSVLTLDINVNGKGGNFNLGEAVFVEVTQDGETFTQVGVAYDEDATYSYEFMSKRINIGAKFAELGLEYGEYQIVLHHDQSAYGHISVDNFALTERVPLYEAGEYYLVVAAASEFTVNVELATYEKPVAPKAYRLASKENPETTTYVYDATDVNRVVRIESDGMVDVLEYNADGTLAGYKTVVTYEDPELETEVEEEVGNVSYVYEDGRLVSYTELAQSWQGPVEVETVVTYNAEGQVVSVLCEDYGTAMTYAYNAEGLVSEMATGYLSEGEVEVDAKEVYTYEDGKLVKQEYMAYDYFLDDDSFYLSEETVYTYDGNGNCIKAETFMIEIDEETEEEVRSLYKTVESYYNTTVLAEDVYTFEYPHFAFTYPVKPAAVNVLTKDMSFITGYDFDGNYGNHSYVFTLYNYDPEILSAPYAPFNLTAEATGTTTVALTWEAYADAETFVVYNGTEKVAEGIEGFEYTVENLKAETEYCFTVKAVNAAGESLASNEACATTEAAPEPDPTVPAAPTNVRATATGPYEIIVEWDAVEDATTYALYYGDEKIGETEGLGAMLEVDTPNAEYCFTVTAINAVGESEHSEEACATTHPDGIEENEASFNIYPNPVENMLFIETEAYVEEVSIYTITGTLIYKEVDFNSNTIDVSEFNGGVYIMKVRTEAGEIVKRFVKK